MFKVLREGGLRGMSANADRIPVLRTGLPVLEPGTASWTWVGHSTYLVRLGGCAILTDPVWSAKISGVARRLTPPGLAWNELPKIDVVVISHDHYDHLDAPTIKRLPRSTPILCGASLGGWFRRRGFTEVTELDWWESAEVAGVRFDFVPSHHWSRRGLLDTCATLWGGWVMTAPDGTRTYHAGDSGDGQRFAEIGERFPGIDLAMMPIGAYDPRWFMRAVHMDPAEAVRALDDVGAKRLASMHWGTFILTREAVDEPLGEIHKAWAASGRDPRDLWALAVGETRTLPMRGTE
jgi:L-ascorbate metabolism protein UlaG (beta-lactamase superfamily)